MAASSEKLAETCARYAEEIQAADITVLDLRGISSIADFFVICTGTSMPHLKAVRRDIRNGVQEALGESPRSAEGDPASQWIILDYVNVLVHIFHQEKRDYYSLEDLWSDAPVMEYDFLTKSED